jgi:osmoprotectant transport system substrate-binding protein
VTSIRPVLALSLAGALVLSACGGDDDEGTPDVVVASPTINVGRTTDSTSQLLAEIYGQGLENSGYRVGRKDAVADRAATLAGLEAGTVQFVPEFSSSLLAEVADATTAGAATSIDDQLTALRAELPATLAVFDPAEVDNGIVVVCSGAAIEEFSLSAISDLADADVTLGGAAAFEDATAGGLAALNAAYETDLAITVVDDVAAAISTGTVDCGALPALTPGIVVNGLITLEDDKSFAPADKLVPLMTIEAGQPDVLTVVQTINATLTTDVVRSLLVKVELGAESIDLIAKQFLASVAPAQ